VNTRTLLYSYRLVFAAILLMACALTIAGSEHNATALAIIEIIGTLLFVWRRSQYAGAAILMGVFAFAEFVSLRHGRLPTYLLQYAAAVVFVVLMDRRLAQRT
jgi:hypothetical protein